MIHTNMIAGLLTASHITPPRTYHMCTRCGITITWDRWYYYGESCNDCAPYLHTTRKAA